jgi:nucleoid DNA-binding protein
MNKSDLIEIVAERLELPNSSAYRAVDAVFDAIGQALFRGERVELRGFGVWKAKLHRARDGRNPRTGEPISLPERWLPFFTAGKEIADRLQDAWLRDQDNLEP